MSIPDLPGIIAMVGLLDRPPVPFQGEQVRSDAFKWDGGFQWDSSHWDGSLWFAVELAVPIATDALWDVATWDDDTWSEPNWVDVTCHVQVVEYTRGASPGSPPDPGDVTIQLDNTNGRFVPWSTDPFLTPAYMGPGTVFRVGFHDSSGGWWPIIVGVANEWAEVRPSANDPRWVTISGYETMSALAQVNDAALAVPVGEGDTLGVRLSRLVNLSGFLYGLSIPAALELGTTFQATEMAGSRLAECQTLSESVFGMFLSNTRGHATYVSRDALVELVNVSGEPVIFASSCGPEFGVTLVPYVADSIVIGNDDDNVVTVVRANAAGGAEVEYPGSDDMRARFGRRVGVWSDQPWSAATTVAARDRLAQRVLDRAEATMRAATCSLHSDHEHALGALLVLDIGQRCDIYAPGVAFRDQMICELTGRIEPRPPGGMVWTVDVSFDVLPESSWEAHDDAGWGRWEPAPGESRWNYARWT